MERTTNYGLYKPGNDDFISVDDLNANMDIIDAALKNAGGNVPANAALLANPTPPAIIAVAEMEE